MAAAVTGRAIATAVDCMSQIGSGALPVDLLPSAGIALKWPDSDRTLSTTRLADAFRRLPLPTIGRIHQDAFVLDFRCLDDEEAFAAQLPQLALPPAQT